MKSKNRFEGFITKLFVLCLIAGVATVAAPLFTADAQTVNIPDANLRTALEQELGKAPGEAITEAELGSRLRSLDARNLSITTLTGLEKATDLRSLNLKGNSISDVSPVVNLPRLRLLNIENNPLSYTSIYTHIPAIQRNMNNLNNARITYTSRSPATLTKISGDSQTGQASAALTNPFVVEVKDGANPAAVFAGVPVKFAVTAGGGILSATTVSTDATGRAQATLTLGSTGGLNAVTASVNAELRQIVRSVTFTATAEVPNSAPTFTSGTSFSVAENNTDVGTVSASDADSSDSITGYTLGGADSSKFAITNTGVLTFANAPDYENPGDALSSTPTNAATNNEYILTVTATSGASARELTATQTLTVTVTDVDEAPGKPSAPTVTAPDAKPTELSVSWTAPSNTGPPITDYDVQYRKGTTGVFTDAGFTGTTTSTTLTGLTAGTSYQVQVRATNAEGTSSWSDAGSATTATNVAPVFSSTTTAFSVAENSNAVITVTATDADTGDTVQTYDLSGADSTAFTFSGGDKVTFSAKPDYENPTDVQSTTPANAARDNEYVITITATSGADARILSTSTTLIITVTDVDEPPAKPDAPTVTAAHATPTSLSVTWTAPTNTGKPAITDYDVQYRKGNSGDFTDAGFTGDATSTTLTGLTAGTSYQVQVRATNAEGTSPWSDAGSATTATNVAPVFSSTTTAFSVAENDTAITTATATDADTGDTITYALSGADSAKFRISTSGALTFSTAPDYENPTDVQSTAPAPADAASNNVYIVTVTANGGTGARRLSVSKTLTVTVTDASEPPLKPNAPTVAAVANTPTQLNVSWTAPTNTGKPAITDYDVQYRKGTTGLFTALTHTGTATTATITGLTAVTSYQVQVRATNDEGTGPWSDAGSGTTLDPLVNIPDANLLAALNAALGSTRPRNAPITESEIKILTTLRVNSPGKTNAEQIGNLTGLEKATSLTTLNLEYNSISDISPLEDLTSLTTLNLGANSISDISPLEDLTSLTTLSLGANSISDISPLEDLTSLTTLYMLTNSISDISSLEDLTSLTTLDLDNNRLSDISSLEDLTSLTTLRLRNNRLSDISPLEDLTSLTTLNLNNNRLSDISSLEDLTSLTTLRLRNNRLSDISSLVSNTGLGTGDSVDLEGNPLSYPSIYTRIPAIQARGATVSFTSRVPTTLTKISGDAQTGAPGAALANPFVVEVKDGASPAKTFAGVEVTFAVTAGGGILSVTTATTGSNGRADAKLTLGSTGGTNTVTASVTHAGTTRSVTFTADANAAPTFSDSTTAFSVPENTTIVTTVTATDPDTGDTVTYALSGADSAKFRISTSGALTFITAPDYENPTDAQSTTPANAASNNVYVVKVTATGGTGARAKPSQPLTLTITVTDVDEPPAKPDAPTVTAGSQSSLNVSWSAPTNTGKPDIDEYDVQYRKGTTGTFINTNVEHTDPATTATITGLTANTSYQVQVRATNDDGTGPWSDSGTGKTDYQAEDVNKDGDVDVDDLIAIGKHIGGTTTPAHEPDVNNDGTVNSADSQLVARAALQNSNALTDIDGDGDVDVEDLVDFAATPVDVNGDTAADDDDIKLIARIALNAAHGDAAPAPSQIHAALNAQNLQHLVQQALQRNRFDATYRRGVAALERILESLIIPEASALLPNYPNPFNPETWIPYQLASPAAVTLTLYDVTGRVVRTLHLGHQHAGMYRSKSRAAYWDGRNAQGEPVASGVYFYTLVAGEFTATGKMLIRK